MIGERPVRHHLERALRELFHLSSSRLARAAAAARAVTHQSSRKRFDDGAPQQPVEGEHDQRVDERHARVQRGVGARARRDATARARRVFTGAQFKSELRRQRADVVAHDARGVAATSMADVADAREANIAATARARERCEALSAAHDGDNASLSRARFERTGRLARASRADVVRG